MLARQVFWAVDSPSWKITITSLTRQDYQKNFPRLSYCFQINGMGGKTWIGAALVLKRIGVRDESHC